MGGTFIIGLVFLGYMVILVIIGLMASAKTNTEEDFFLGGRRIGTWVTAVSSTASSESGWVILGIIGLVYKEGLSSIWFMPGCLLGYWFNWRFIAPKLRVYSKNTAAITLPDLFEEELGDSGHSVRMVSVFIIFASMMGYVAAQFTAAAKAFHSTFSLDYNVSILIGATLVILYTLMGGYRAVSWTDLFQGLLMVFALVILPVVAVNHVGGIGALWNKLAPRGEFLSLVKGNAFWGSVGAVLGLLGIGLGYPGQPHVLQRFMAAEDDRVIRRGKYIALSWGVLVYTGSIILGLAGRVLIPEIADPEHVFPELSKRLLHPALSGLMLSAVMASIMSTADSQLLVAASSVVRDVYEKMIGRRVGEKKLVLLSRIAVLVLGLLSIIVAITDIRAVFWFVLFAWAGLGAGFGPLVILILRDYRFQPRQAITGMLLGFSLTIIWKVSGMSAYLYELVPSFLCSLLYLRVVGKKTVQQDRGQAILD